MEQILKSELQVKSAISIGVFDIIEQLDDGVVIIKADERTKLKFFNGELDILMHGQSHYRIKGIRSGGLLLAKAELVDEEVAAQVETNTETSNEAFPEYVPTVNSTDAGDAVTTAEDNNAVAQTDTNQPDTALQEA